MTDIEKKLILYKILSKGHHINHFMSDVMTLMINIIYPWRKISNKEARDFWEEFLKSDSQKKGVLNFYLHILYCFKKCFYCNCSSYQLENKKQLETYLKALINYFRYFKKTFSRTSFTNLFIGGGTPSVLSEKQIGNLLSELFSCFKFDKDGKRHAN